MEINLTVILKTKPESTEIFRSILLDLVQKSTKEKACIQYELHQSEKESNIFIFHETWENQESLDLHTQQTYLVSFFESAQLHLLEAPVIYKTNKL